MALGREVADAYISVHGDLAPFRRDLAGAEADGRAAAIDAADAFGDAWAKRTEQQVGGQWHRIVDAMYKNDKVDWERLLGDTSKIDETFTDLTDLMSDMVDKQKMTNEEFTKTFDIMEDVVGKMKERSKIEEQYGDAVRENLAYDERRVRTMEAANKENERWARTLDGIRKNNAIGNLEKDFRKLAEVMKSADMEDFAKDFDSLSDAEQRINDITAAMEQQGRITSAQADELKANMNAYIDSVNTAAALEKEAADAKSKAMRDALDATNKATAAQDRYNRSLSGMARNYHFGKLENDFRNLAAAMDSNDFSVFAQGALDIEHMRQNIVHTANEMRRLGRMTDTEYGLILDKMQELNHSFADGSRNGGNFFRTLRAGANRFGTAMRGINNATRGFREHLQGFAGLNVFGDMIRKGLDFVHNLDRIALRTSKATLLLGAMASIGGSSLAGLAVIAADLGATLGGLGVALPAFLVGAGIGLGVLIAAFKDTKTVLADLKKPLAEFQDSISRDFWKQAADPIRAMAKHLLPILHNPKGTSTATSLGKVFKSLAESITAIPADKINTMFDRMNGAIDTLAGAMPPLIRAFTNLGMVGSKYFNRFSTWLVKLSTDFDAFIQKAYDNGDLDKWINNMIEGFKNIGRSIDGTLGMFNAIASAARAAGSGGLKEFADKLQAMAATMQSPAFQGTLTMLFSGMNLAVKEIGQSLYNLGPALQSVMPSIKLALVDIGDAVGLVIKYLGDILSNPHVQKGITDFSSGMVAALEKLAPAIKPFGDSLGTMMTLLGQIIQSVSQVATTFMVELSPVLDRMSTKLGTLVQPLADGVSKFITDMKVPLEALEKQFVEPLVSAFRDKLLPAITGPGGFSEEFSKFVTRIVEAAGPSFKTLVNEVLPNLVTTVTELLDPLGKFIAFFTPTLNTVLKGTADGIKGIGDAVKVLKGEMPIGDIEIFKPGAMDRAVEKSEEDFKAAWDNREGMSWGDIFDKLMGGGSDAGQAFGIMWTEKIFPALKEGWDKDMKRLEDFFGDTIRNNMDLSQTIGDAIREGWENDMRNLGDFEDTVNKWFDDNVFQPMEDLGKDIGKLWDETIGKFFDSVFGGGETSGAGGGSGGGAGGVGMGVTGKLDPAMLGLPDEEGTRGWFEEFGTWLWEGFTGALARLGEVLGLNEFGTKWDEFWAGLPVKVQEAWDAVVLWVTTKAAEIKLAVDTFIADAQLNWTLFWDSVPVKVQEAWDAVLLWIQTKAAEIKLAIDTWIADAKLNWDNFWNGVNTKVEEIWTAVFTWIDTKIAEIKTAIDTFITDTKTNWDNFWNGLKTKVETTWNDIKTWVDTKIREVKTAIDNFIRDTKTNWDNFWRDLPGHAQRGWDKIVEEFRKGVDRAVEWVRSLPGKLVAAIGNGFTVLAAQGGAIMDGLLNGLSGGKWTQVKNFVSGVAQWIKDNKGPISYDRKLLIPAGQAIMGGFDASLRSGFGGVMDTVETMADTVAAAFAHSKMYLAGADAALGIADGLASKKGVLSNVLGSIIPNAELAAKITATGTGGVGTPTPVAQRIINIEKGAVQVSTPTKNPELVASSVIDRLVINSNL